MSVPCFKDIFPSLKTILNIAHRGASGLAPENTISSFGMALKIGADMVELDVHLSRDGVPVVIHDETADRVTGRITMLPGSEMAVKRMALDDLKELDVGSWFGPEFSGERIPTLQEVLELLTGRARAIIEIKRGSDYYPGIEEKVVHLIQSVKHATAPIISSFELTALKRVRSSSPDIPLGIIFDTPTWDYILKAAGTLRASVLCPEKSLVGPDRCDEAHSRGLGVCPYTVNTEDEMKTLIGMGVDGLITNRPDTLKNLLHG